MPEVSTVHKGLPKQVIFFTFLVFMFLWFSPMLIQAMGLTHYSIFFLAAVPTFLLLGVVFLKKDRNFDPFIPLTFSALTVFVGTTLRGFWLLTSDFTGYTQQRLLHGESPNFLFLPAAIIIFGFAFLVLGYSLKIKRLKLDTFLPVIKQKIWSEKKLWVIVFFLTIISTVAAVIFFKKVGMTELTAETFSGKRRTYLDAGRFQRVSHGYYRWMASLIKFPYYLVLIHFAYTGKKIFSRWGPALLFLGFLAMLFPIMTSSRSHLMFLVINTIIIWYYFRGFPYLLVGLSIPASFLIVFGMLILRKNKELTADKVQWDSVLEAVTGNFNMMGIAKTGHIINGIPGQLDYAYGSSMISWIFAPIPRSMWHEKPYMNSGSIIRQKIFIEEGEDFMGGGIPPGIIAELYWNFSVFGLTIGMFLIGRFLKLVYTSFLPYLPRSPNAMFIYTTFIVQISFVLIGDSFNQAFLQSLQNIIPAFILIFILRNGSNSEKSLTE